MAIILSQSKIELEKQVRKQLNEVTAEYPVTATFFARELGWNRDNIIKFKNGRTGYSEQRLLKLQKLLDKTKSIG